jgi:hypothetical protein
MDVVILKIFFRDKIVEEEVFTISLEREPGRQLGIRLCGSNPADPGIFIADIQVNFFYSLTLDLWKAYYY